MRGGLAGSSDHEKKGGKFFNKNFYKKRPGRNLSISTQVNQGPPASNPLALGHQHALIRPVREGRRNVFCPLKSYRYKS